MATIFELNQLINTAKSTSSGTVEWNNNSLQNIMINSVSPLIQERGMMRVGDLDTLMATSGTETQTISILNVGIFFWNATGTVDNITIFPAAGGGVWIRQTGAVTGIVWGGIGGTLSDQTDLQSALNAKVNTSTTVNGHALSSNVAVTKGDIGLGNVENTALSTWAGTSNITTVGTIGTGTWNASTISIAKGGTGQTTANSAFNALAPTQTGQSGKFLTTDGTNTSWSSVAGITTIYTGDGTIGADRTVDANFGGSVNGQLLFNHPFESVIQILSYKTTTLYTSMSNYICRPNLNPSSPTSSPQTQFLVMDSVSGTQYYTNVSMLRDSVSIQQSVGSQLRQLVFSSAISDAIYQDTNGHGIAYYADYSANYTDRTLIDRGFIDDRFLGGIATFSGDGITTLFDINIGTGVTTLYHSVDATTLAAAGTFASAEIAPGTIRVQYGAAPASGTNNVQFSWFVRRNL